MSKKDANINKDLQQWLRGEANLSQERQLDQQAKDDPFLAEALEGYRQFPAGDHTKTAKRLRQKINRRKRSNQPRLFLRIAASIAILLIAGAVIYYNQPLAEKTQADNFAPPPPATESFSETGNKDNEAPREEQPIAQADNLGSAIEEKIVPPPSSPPKPRTDDAPSQEIPNKIESAKDRTEVDQLAELSADEIPTEELADEDIAIVEETADDVAEQEPNYSPPANRPTRADNFEGNVAKKLESTNAAAPIRRTVPPQLAQSAKDRGKRPVFGLILDAMGDPLVGATISIQDTKQTTITDFRGEFELLIDSAQHVLQIDYIGYNSLQVDLPAGGAISERFTLDDEALAINEVQYEIDGLSSTRIKKLEPIAEPVGGRAAFRRYVRDNAARGLPKGRVRLRFKIDADGQPYDIHVDKSNNPVLNSSAMSLLLRGPKWNIVQGIPPIDMTFTIRFK